MWLMSMSPARPSSSAFGPVRVLSCKVILWQLYEPTCDASCQELGLEWDAQREKSYSWEFNFKTFICYNGPINPKDVDQYYSVI